MQERSYGSFSSCVIRDISEWESESDGSYNSFDLALLEEHAVSNDTAFVSNFLFAEFLDLWSKLGKIKHFGSAELKRGENTAEQTEFNVKIGFFAIRNKLAYLLHLEFFSKIWYQNPHTRWPLL